MTMEGKQKTKAKYPWKIHPHGYEIEDRSLCCYFIGESAQCLQNLISLHCSVRFFDSGNHKCQMG